MIKIYIHTDLEGIAGIDSFEMMQRTSETYRDCCKLLMGDLNAAIEGAFAGGADHVTVLDSHGGGSNFKLELLDPRAENTRPTSGGILDELSGHLLHRRPRHVRHDERLPRPHAILNPGTTIRSTGGAWASWRSGRSWRATGTFRC